MSLSAVIVLTACGGGEAEDSAASGRTGESGLVATTITGSVGDGPITGGKVTIYDASGNELVYQSSNELALYRVELSVASDDFPLIARVEDGIDIVTGEAPSFALVTAVMEAGGERVANLNPFGTLAVAVAQKMPGGLNQNNLTDAISAVNDQLGFGIGTRGIVDPIGTDVNAQNAASMVRASEALGETIRRVHAALAVAGQSVSIDSVMASLSADLVDGVIDGEGAAGADPRVAATTTVVSAQVMLETMTNGLRVNDAPATVALDAAIQQIMNGDPTVPLTSSLPVTDRMLAQSRVLVSAAMAIDTSGDLASISDALAGAPFGLSPAQLSDQLPLRSIDMLETATVQVVLARSEELAEINATMRDANSAGDSADNRLPTISGVPATTIMVGDAYDFTPNAIDGDGDELSFTVSNQPAWLEFDTATGRLSGTPTAGDVRTYFDIRIGVADGFGSASLPAFDLTVEPRPNQAPEISGSAPTSVTVGNQFEFLPIANDVDGDALAFSVAGLPDWANFDSATGRLRGTPDVTHVGVWSGIQISVSDGSDRASLLPFSVTVNAIPNVAPAIFGTPAGQVTIAQLYSFRPSASDPDGDSLTFSIAGKPRWASFDATTGRLWGTPTDGDAGVYSDIRISVSDGRDTSMLAPFSIAVNPRPNVAPTIGGSPAQSVTVGSGYVFTPSASDADGDELAFSIAGRPSWASFSVADGQLSGTPSDADVGIYSNIRISVSDGRDSVTLPAFSIEVEALPNAAPTIAGSPATAVTAGASYAFTPSAGDADGDALTFSIAGRPAWASFNAGNGRLSGNPTESDIGEYSNIRISVSDGRDTTSLAPFSIIVNATPNLAPSISGVPAGSVTVGSGYSFTPTASDPDGDTLTFSIAGLPGWANFDPATGRLSGVPNELDSGIYSGIRISVSDGRSGASLSEFSITVNAIPNQLPTIGGSPSTQVMVDSAYSFRPGASDPDGDALTFSIAGQPMWASFSPATGALSGVPVAGDEGLYSDIRISVSDGKDTVTLPAFSITVVGLPNAAPSIGGSPAAVVTVGGPYEFTPTASDPDGDELSFSVVAKPAWANFNTSTGRLAGTPGDDDVGVYSGIRISVSDGSASANLAAFSITVEPQPNTPPTISGVPPINIVAGSSYSFRPAANDADGDTLTFSIVGKPAWATFNRSSGRLSGRPGESDVGVSGGITISVSDGTDSAALPPFSITVSEPPNRAPTISGSPSLTATVDSAYSFTPNASDPDGDALTFTISGQPAWASFDTGSGRLFGTPSAGEEGEYTGIRISVSDGEDSATLSAFAITVAALPNAAPTISGSPAGEVTVNAVYDFTPSATDPDGDRLTFLISGKPSWASFDSGSGRLSGTPAESDEGVYGNIVISVSDGEDSASLPSFSVVVQGLPNNPPTIDGAPSSEVVADSNYDFLPTAVDADGDTLTFSIQNRPSWATFRPDTGRLSGVPGAGDVGSYSNIVISVSDGSDTVSLPAFSIDVVAVTLGSATLSWDAPTRNEDGSELDDLDGFNIYYGQSVDSMNTVISVDNETVTTALIENLTPGTWYFKVTAFDTSDNESGDSNLGSKLIVQYSIAGP